MYVSYSKYTQTAYRMPIEGSTEDTVYRKGVFSHPKAVTGNIW